MWNAFQKNADEKCGTQTHERFLKKISKKRVTHGDSKKKLFFKKPSSAPAVDESSSSTV